MKKSAFFLLVILSITFYSCEEDLIDLGGGYKLGFTGHSRNAYNSSIIQPGRGGLLVEASVLDYAFDSIFIIAIQRPWSYPIPNWFELNYYEKRKEMDKITFRQYWIINKAEEGKFIYIEDRKYDSRSQSSNVYGPFQREEYLQKRKELGVPESLVLKEDAKDDRKKAR